LVWEPCTASLSNNPSFPSKFSISIYFNTLQDNFFCPIQFFLWYNDPMRRFSLFFSLFIIVFLGIGLTFPSVALYAEENEDAFQRRFAWWPSDAKPAPVQDMDRGGYWWWPEVPGASRPWGNRGYIYVRKVIFDYQDLPTTSKEQLKPSLIIKKVHKNIKVYFDFDQADLRADAIPVLEGAVRILNKNPDSEILITGNADMRGSEQHNFELAEGRAEAIRQFIIEADISKSRIRIVSRGKLDALAPVTDLVGLQRDRNAQFMVADVVEVMIPEAQRKFYEPLTQQGQTEEGSPVYLSDEPEIEEVETEVIVSFREHTVQEGDTLGALAKEVYGNAVRWEYIYNFNKDTIENPHKLKVGQVIRIPKE
jgi:outer membrane protein OmpA-like peptidoglycan-associated protein